jgi:hypothetical protein
VLICAGHHADVWWRGGTHAFYPISVPVPQIVFAQGVDLRGGSARPGQGANIRVAQGRHWNNQKYGASKFKFPHVKYFLRKLSAV